ncbi:hypothetical protein BCR43DRAFT_508475 [Syncephalastrum racemosum]|uniref:Uncharacterized protein n=1 Tax=Syncephalastrum racemosum TaxID=13706 RepID=A0A1X2H0W4_SYNRA|nr:hypothetical protein BCR43DRAFT_508475 [Syncephalastrum racemosum]
MTRLWIFAGLCLLFRVAMADRSCSGIDVLYPTQKTVIGREETAFVVLGQKTAQGAKLRKVELLNDLGAVLTEVWTSYQDEQLGKITMLQQDLQKVDKVKNKENNQLKFR